MNASAGLLGDALQNAGDDVALAADRANDRGLAANAANGAASAAVLIDGLAADVGFVNFDNTAKLFLRPNERIL
jgi:hypothetical protein